MMQELLSDREKELLLELTKVANMFDVVIKSGNFPPIMQPDWHEVEFHIHALQNMVLAQAAASAYPKEYRSLGSKVNQ